MAAAAPGPSEGSAPVRKVGPLCVLWGSFPRVYREALAPQVLVPPQQLVSSGKRALLPGVPQRDILGAVAH